VIPIVFAAVGDPVGAGVVKSLARPGGNATGLSLQQPNAPGKRLELLRQVIPGLRHLAIMANSGNPSAALDMREVEAAARTLGLAAVTSEIRRSEDIAPAFDAFKGRVQALYVRNDPLASTNRVRINTLASAGQLPTIFIAREYVDAGGLMSYGASFEDLYRHTADLVDKILRGAKPADIPVEQPTKFDLVINLTTAKAVGVEVPPTHLPCPRRRGDRIGCNLLHCICRLIAQRVSATVLDFMTAVGMESGLRSGCSLWVGYDPNPT
jgi:putative tryptophan/tyrosine transport system substrate-binding protein